MTTASQIESPTTTCPQWCTTPDCMGEHTSDGEYRPTTGGLPRVEHGIRTSFPTVSVSLAWNTVDHLQPCVTVHAPGAGSRGSDAQFDLLPHEARQLVADLTERLGQLEAAQ